MIDAPRRPPLDISFTIFIVRLYASGTFRNRLVGDALIFAIRKHQADQVEEKKKRGERTSFSDLGCRRKHFRNLLGKGGGLFYCQRSEAVI